MGTNADLARIFWDMAQLTLYLDEGKFVARAYRVAHDVIKHFPEDMGEYFQKKGREGLMEISGIGPAIASKIAEFLETGRVSAYEEMKRRVPRGALELMAVRGLGPATARRLHEEMEIKGLDDLRNALVDGRLEKMKGFGPKRIARLKKELGL